MKRTPIIIFNILLSVCVFSQGDSKRKINDNDQNIFVDGYQSFPEFPGGDEARVKYCQTLAIYTNQAIEERIEGIVYTNFTIENDGSISNLKLLRGIHHDLDSIAIWMIRMMPRFIPANLNGKAISISYTLPIRFKLNGRSLSKKYEPSNYWANEGHKSFYDECFSKSHRTVSDCDCWYGFIIRNYNELEINSIDLDVMYKYLKCN